MADEDGDRSLAETPTWAIAVICFVLVAVSILTEYIIRLIEKWLRSKHKILYEAFEKIKSELVLLGFLSLLLTLGQIPITRICISEKVGVRWHPCYTLNKHSDDTDSSEGARHSFAAAGGCATKGKVPFVSSDSLDQLDSFISFLVFLHVLYCILTYALGRAKMGSWKAWEKEITRTAEYQFSHDPERFRFARETSFGRRHLSFWSRTPVLLWTVCFFRQFVRSVPKVDYSTLRHGFITAHLAPQSHSKFDFQKYINRSLEEDFKVVVGISPPLWFFAMVFLLLETHGLYSYLWLPFIPLIIILLVGTKLQVIVTKMGLRIEERSEVVAGVPVVQPADDLFWFNRPRLILYLIHFVLFQNAFQLAFFAWIWYEFGLKSCFNEHMEGMMIRITMGVLIQILCSYVTLPLYALVTQMGSTMKPTIFNEGVAEALKNWHHTAKKHVKESKHSGMASPMSSRHATPSHGMLPIHLLRNYRSEVESYQNSPNRSNFDMERWQAEGSTSPTRFHQGFNGSSHQHQIELGLVEHESDFHGMMVPIEARGDVDSLKEQLEKVMDERGQLQKELTETKALYASVAEAFKVKVAAVETEFGNMKKVLESSQRLLSTKEESLLQVEKRFKDLRNKYEAEDGTMKSEIKGEIIEEFKKSHEFRNLVGDYFVTAEQMGATIVINKVRKVQPDFPFNPKFLEKYYDPFGGTIKLSFGCPRSGVAEVVQSKANAGPTPAERHVEAIPTSGDEGGVCTDLEQERRYL